MPEAAEQDADAISGNTASSRPQVPDLTHLPADASSGTVSSRLQRLRSIRASKQQQQQASGGGKLRL